MQDQKFNLVKDLYEQALTREENRKNTYEQKSANLVGFLGATVGVFIGTLIPVLLAKEFLCQVFSSLITTVLWIASMICFTGGMISFVVLVWLWRRMLSPVSYMYPDPSSLHPIEDLGLIEKEYINDLRKSVEFNQNRVNNIGTQFMKMVLSIKFIVILFFMSVFFLVLSKLFI